MSECIFCGIVHQQLPAHVIYQTENVICFLPKAPEVYGHTLIVPKQHIPDIYTAPKSALEELMVITQRLAIHYKTQIGASGVNVLHASGASAQQSIFHFHLHLIPRFDNDGLNTWPVLSEISFDKDAMLERLKLL